MVHECFLNRRVGEPFVLAGHRVAALRYKSATREEAERGVARIGGELSGAARRGELFERVAKLGPDALPGHGGMDVEHVDHVRALESPKADRRALECGDQRQ